MGVKGGAPQGEWGIHTNAGHLDDSIPGTSWGVYRAVRPRRAETCKLGKRLCLGKGDERGGDSGWQDDNRIEGQKTRASLTVSPRIPTSWPRLLWDSSYLADRIIVVHPSTAISASQVLTDLPSFSSPLLRPLSIPLTCTKKISYRGVASLLVRLLWMAATV